MKTLALHLACLDQLSRDQRRVTRAEAIGIVIGASIVSLALAGSFLLESLVRERLGG